jgi:hypothetical protein
MSRAAIARRTATASCWLTGDHDLALPLVFDERSDRLSPTVCTRVISLKQTIVS